MRKYLLALLFMLCGSPVWAQCTTLPFTLLPGTTADGGQVMADLNALNLNCGGTGLTLGPPNQLVFPIGNPVPTMTSLGYQTTTASTTTREYGFALGLNNDKRASLGAVQSQGDTATLFTGIRTFPGGGNSWALNAEAVSGVPYGMALAAELDIESDNDTDPATGVAGLRTTAIPNSTAFPYTYGVWISGASSHTITAGSVVAGGAGGFRRGYVCTSNIIDACFIDYSGSAIAIDLRGGHTVAAIDMTNISTPTFIKSASFTVLSDGAIQSISTADSASLELKSTGTNTPDFLLQTVTDVGGRFRIYDLKNAWESVNITQGSTGHINLNLATTITLPVSCAGQPTGTLWNNSSVVNVCP